MYRTVRYSGGLSSKAQRFLLVTMPGEITEFYFYSEDPMVAVEADRPYDLVYYKWHDPKNDKPVTNSKFVFSFAKNMSEYVADYPELAEKVRNKEKGYGMLDMTKIMTEYNAWYASKTNN
jgi:hypothetical protein